MSDFETIRILDDIRQSPLEGILTHRQDIKDEDLICCGDGQQLQHSVTSRSVANILQHGADSDLFGAQQSRNCFLKDVALSPDVEQVCRSPHIWWLAG